MVLVPQSWWPSASSSQPFLWGFLFALDKQAWSTGKFIPSEAYSSQWGERTGGWLPRLSSLGRTTLEVCSPLPPSVTQWEQALQCILQLAHTAVSFSLCLPVNTSCLKLLQSDHMDFISTSNLDSNIGSCNVSLLRPKPLSWLKIFCLRKNNVQRI